MSLRTLKDGREVFALPEFWGYEFDVTVIGCGGTGSEMVDALMRLHHVLLHFGHQGGIKLTLIDGDTVSQANVGRQRFLSADIAKNKAAVLARRYGLLYDTDIRVIPKQCTAGDLSHVCHRAKLLITCVDKAEFRLQVAEFGRRKNMDQQTWLDLGNGSHSGQVVLGALSDTKKGTLPNVASLFPELRQVDDNDEPSCSLEAALAAQRLGINRLLVDAAVFSILAPLFTQGHIDVHGAFVDLAKASMRPLKIGAESWGFLGHTRP